MKIFISLLIIGLTSCIVPEDNVETMMPLPELSDIEALMRKQETAWNSGDIASFMNGYWNSDSLLFIGSRGLTKGYSTTLNNYIQSYPDSSAMGRLEFNNREIFRLEKQHALVIGTWTLYRSSDTLNGMYSLTWRWHEKRGWEIIADHSS